MLATLSEVRLKQPVLEALVLSLKHQHKINSMLMRTSFDRLGVLICCLLLWHEKDDIDFSYNLYLNKYYILYFK